MKIISADGSWTIDELPKLFNFVAAWTDTNTGDRIKLQTGKCQDVYQNVSNLAIYSSGLQDAMCPANFSVPVYGNSEIGGNAFMSLFLFPCRNSTNSPIICKSREQLKEILQYTYFQVIYIEKLVYPNNYLDPLTKTTVVYWDYLEYMIMKNIEFYYKTINILTDVGLILPDIVNTTDVLFDNKMYTKQLHVTDPGMPYMQVDILVTNKNVYVKRTYDKLQNVFANLGGVIKSLMLIGQILVFIFNRKVMEFDMVNSFYDFSNYNDDDVPKEKIVNTNNKLSKNFYVNYSNNASRTQKDNTINNLSINNKIELSNISPDSIRNNDENPANNSEIIADKTARRKLSESYKIIEKTNNAESKTKLLYSPVEILKLSLCPGKCLNKKLKTKSKLLSSSHDYIKAVLDLASMIKTTHDLSLVKSILLNENQLEFADHMKKTKFTEKLLNPDFENKLNSLGKYYKEKITSGTFSEIDKKLFDNLEDNMKNVLQKYE